MPETNEHGDFYAVIYHVVDQGYRGYIPPNSGREVAIQGAKNLIKAERGRGPRRGRPDQVGRQRVGLRRGRRLLTVARARGGSR